MPVYRDRFLRVLRRMLPSTKPIRADIELKWIMSAALVPC